VVNHSVLKSGRLPLKRVVGATDKDEIGVPLTSFSHNSEIDWFHVVNPLTLSAFLTPDPPYTSGVHNRLQSLHDAYKMAGRAAQAVLVSPAQLVQ
jgi:hypothetical protein